MKILYVHGDDDYAALTYEQEIGKEKALAAMKEVYDKDVEIGEGIYARLMDIGQVSHDFVRFIREEIQDYEDAKHKNFYEV